MESNPMIFCVVDNKLAPQPTNDYKMNWLALNVRNKEVFVEVEACDSEGLEKFRKDYKGHFSVVKNHVLKNPLDWKILIGDASNLRQDDPLKLIRHLTYLKSE